jgi:REP element-mobilizing transposase RayT
VDPIRPRKETEVREWQSLSHVRWYCRYHVVFVPKYRKKSIFGQLRKGIGNVLRQLCEQRVWNWWRGTPWRITCTCA